MKLKYYKKYVAFVFVAGVYSVMVSNVMAEEFDFNKFKEVLECRESINNQQERDQERERERERIGNEVFQSYPLHKAVYQGKYDEVQRLLVSGAYKVNSRHTNGRTPLHVCSDPLIADFLISCGANLYYRDELGRLPLQSILYMAMSDDEDAAAAAIIRILLSKDRDNRMLSAVDCLGDTSLHTAVRCRNIYAVRSLLNAGADKTVRNHDGQTPLALSIILGAKEIGELLINHNVQK